VNNILKVEYILYIDKIDNETLKSSIIQEHLESEEGTIPVSNASNKQSNNMHIDSINYNYLSTDDTLSSVHNESRLQIVAIDIQEEMVQFIKDWNRLEQDNTT